MISSSSWVRTELSTAMNIWLYPHQVQGWTMVGFEKIISWFLLMHFSFLLIYAKQTMKGKKVNHTFHSFE